MNYNVQELSGIGNDIAMKLPTYRVDKGEPLTHEEMDAMFAFLFAVAGALFHEGILLPGKFDPSTKASELSITTSFDDRLGIALDGASAQKIVDIVRRAVGNRDLDGALIDAVNRIFSENTAYLFAFMHQFLDSDEGTGHLFGKMHQFMDADEGREHLYGVIYEFLNTDGAKAHMASLAVGPDDVTTGTYFDGQRLFDKATHKTLTFYGGKLYDAMGDVEYDLSGE